MSTQFISEITEEEIAGERRKARRIRNSPWWKNKRGAGICYYCKGRFHPSELTMDHVVPIIRGGKSVKGNVVPCCKECNSRKKHYLPLEWEEYMDGLSD